MTSLDGFAWTNRDTGATNRVVNLAYGNHLFVAVVEAWSWPDRGLGTLTSTDGTTWACHTLTQGDVDYQDIAYGNNQFVLVLGINLPGVTWIMTSPDGVTWTQHSTFPVALHGVVFGNNSFLLVGDLGAILQSGPIINLSLTPGATPGFLSLTLEGPTGLDYVIQSSTDLVSWQAVTNGTSVQPTMLIPIAVAPAAEHAFYRAYAQ